MCCVSRAQAPKRLGAVGWDTVCQLTQRALTHLSLPHTREALFPQRCMVRTP